MPRTQLYTIDDLFVGDAPEAFGALGFDDTPAFANSFQDGPGSSLGAGEFIGNTIMQDGYLKSSNFISGTSGWYLGPDGTIEAVNGTFSGAITAASGAIGGWVVTATALKDAAGVVGLSSAVTGGDDIRFWAGDATPGSAEFRVTEAGALTASSATISGSITATSGAIGGFTVGADYLRDAADSFGLASTVSGSDDVRFWAGNTFANRATAAFRVTEAGAVTASSMTITGGAITSTPIASIPNNSSTDISLLEKTHTMVFSVTDLNTIAWGSGTVTLSNGRTFSISAGNTGNMAALTYIYLDPGVSLTVLQTTTTAATAMGANKILIGTAQNNTVTASYIPYGPGQPLIDGANIGALSIVAGNIAASTITATKLTVSQLSAIAADLGAITAGTVTLDTAGHVKGGQTAYETGTGFFLGYSTAAYKFSIGSTTNFLKWDGSALSIKGSYITYAAGDLLLASSDDTTTTLQTAYTKAKEIDLGGGSGTLRIKFSLSIEPSTATAYGRIYRNGVAVGTERSTSSDNPTLVEFSEDIAGWSASDLIQVYIKTETTGNKTCYLNNFRVYAISSIIPAVTYSPGSV